MIAGHEDKITIEDRGHSTPCHVWIGAHNSNGYGLVRVGDRVRTAHRLSYELEHGEIRAGLGLDHLCCVRACVNAAHLEPVTTAENNRRGSRTRLTPADVEEIRAASGVSNVKLADQYGVSPAWISRIRSGRSANRKGPQPAWA